VLLRYEFPDYILKFIDDDTEPRKQRKRDNFERLLLCSGLILEHELDSDLECTVLM